VNIMIAAPLSRVQGSGARGGARAEVDERLGGAARAAVADVPLERTA
jgi:hypothetical protein